MEMMSIELLTSARVTELWSGLEPYFAASCAGNEIAVDEISSTDVYLLAQTDMCAIFVGWDGTEIGCVLAVQFTMTNGVKGADIIGLAGQKLTRFKNQYWGIILEWLRANDVIFLNAFVPEKRARMYQKRFGFDKSCSYVRMTL